MRLGSYYIGRVQHHDDGGATFTLRLFAHPAEIDVPAEVDVKVGPKDRLRRELLDAFAGDHKFTLDLDDNDLPKPEPICAECRKHI